jgi:dsRNA-specific ribonuclease
MRHHSPEVVQAHKNAGHTFEQCGAEIQKILSEGATYPWKLLARLGLDKFYSDLVESVFGAVFNDSQGDLSECEKLFERIGLKYYAARMAEGSLDVVHPRDELQGLIGSSKLEIDVQPVFSGEDRAIFVCSVRVEGTVIAEAQGCITEDEACVGGIQAAVAFLRSQQEGRGR